MMNSFSLSNFPSIRAVSPAKYIIIFASLFFIALPKSSYAIQATFSGDYEVRYLTMGNLNELNDNIADDVSYADLRFRLKSIFAINENTKGIVHVESGHTIFGLDTTESSEEYLPGEDNINLKLKNVYVDFFLPNRVSRFKVGLQPIRIFDGLLANEDAFGATYVVDADRYIQVNMVKISENKPDEEYANTDNPQRTSNFASIFYENEIFKVDTYQLLFGYYVDKEAIIDNVMYTKRKAVYYGLGYKWQKHGFDSAFHLVYDSGKKKYVDSTSGIVIGEKSKGFLADLTTKRRFGSVDMDFEFLIATGDDNKQDEKDTEFMALDGLTNFYDRAYILTGYITRDNADEKVDVFDTNLYKLENIIFFKLRGKYNFTDSTMLDLSVMHASNDKPVTNQAGKRATDIGMEIDATLSIDLFDTYFATEKGLLLNIFSGYFIPSTAYENPDGSDPDNVYLFGTGLEYTF